MENHPPSCSRCFLSSSSVHPWHPAAAAARVVVSSLMEEDGSAGLKTTMNAK